MNSNLTDLIEKAQEKDITQSEFEARALKHHYRLNGRWDAQHRIPALEELPCYALSEATSTGTNNAAFTKKSPGGLLD